MDETTQKRRALVIDHDANVARILRIALGDAGMVTSVTGDLESAWLEINALRPDVIVTDRHLPDGTVDDLLAGLASSPLADVPVIVTCAAEAPDAHPMIRASLERPLTGPAVVATVEALLGPATPDAAAPAADVHAAHDRARTLIDAAAGALVGALDDTQRGAAAAAARQLAGLGDVMGGDAVAAAVHAGQLLTAGRVTPRAAVTLADLAVTIGESLGVIEAPPAATLADIDDGAPAPQPEPATAADVLLIDSDEQLVPLVAGALTAAGLTCDHERNGRDALQRLLDGDDTPGLVLLAASLEGLTGDAVLTSLAAAGVTERCPVIMLTDHARDEDVVRALELGALDHIAKPVSLRVLVQRVKSVLERT